MNKKEDKPRFSKDFMPLSFKTDLNDESSYVTLDAASMPYGRLCVNIANELMGKTNIFRDSSVFSGKIVTILNSSKIFYSGKEPTIRRYISSVRKIKALKASEVINKNTPKGLFFKTLRGMLPKNRLYRQVIKNCIIFK